MHSPTSFTIPLDEILNFLINALNSCRAYDMTTSSFCRPSGMKKNLTLNYSRNACSSNYHITYVCGNTMKDEPNASHIVLLSTSSFQRPIYFSVSLQDMYSTTSVSLGIQRKLISRNILSSVAGSTAHPTCSSDCRFYRGFPFSYIYLVFPRGLNVFLIGSICHLLNTH